MKTISILPRLDEFRALEDGWLEGHGVAPSPTGLDWFARLSSVNTRTISPCPTSILRSLGAFSWSGASRPLKPRWKSTS